MLRFSMERTIRFLLLHTMIGGRGYMNAEIEVANSCRTILVPLLLRCTLEAETVPSASQPPEHDVLQVVQ